MHVNFSSSSPLEAVHGPIRYSLQLRWRSLPPRKAALAAPRAAGMPVRRPRWPTAVSAAFEADAGPELGCAGQLEQAAEAPNGEVSSLWVGLSVSRSGGRSGLVRRSISRLGLCLVGSSVRAGALCFRGLGIRIFCLRPCLCAEVGLRLCVCAPFGAIPPSRNPLVLPFRSLVRSRLRSRGDGKRRCRARLRLRLRLRWVVGWVLLVGAQSRTRARVE